MVTREISSLILLLEGKDNQAAYKALQELERISEETDSVYAYIRKFIDMIGSDQYTIRVRGFRLFCRQARWDTDYIIDESIDEALGILKDEKPTAVRQALAALPELIKYKPDLREIVKRSVSDINYLRYKDTMHSLIAGDMRKVLQLIDQNIEV